jgi:ATP-dependent DNA ligase
LRAIREPSFAIDGEILILEGDHAADFAAVMLRLHPAESRVRKLAVETPATFVAFDVLAIGDEDLRDVPFASRRAHLERLLRNPTDRVIATPIADDPLVAREWLARKRAGVDGVVAKARDLRYRAGARAMTKVKSTRTADCVVAGMRVYGDAVASLVLGLYDGAALRHVGVVIALPDLERRRLFDELRPLVTSLRGHPWEHGFGLGPSPLGRLGGSAGRWDPAHMELDWTPLRPERVVEVRYDIVDADRFRHPAQLVRWRPDRDPRSCTIEQLREAAHA